MNDDEFTRWVDAYIRHCHSEEGTQAFDETFWVYDWILDAIRAGPDNPAKNPELLWRFILAVLDRDTSPRLLEMLAAGPLEELLARHGNAFIERVELQARREPAFRDLLGGVWKNEMASDVWIRVEIARMHRRW